MPRLPACLLLFCAPLLLWRSESATRVPQTFSQPVTLQSGIACDIPVHNGSAEITLPADGASYDVLLTSLGDPLVDHQVELQLKTRNVVRNTAVSQLNIAEPKPKSISDPRLLPVKASRPVGVPAVRTFHLHVTDGPLGDERQYAQVTAVPIAEGETVRVYLDGVERPTRSRLRLARELIRVWEHRIAHGLQRLLGNVPDIDGDGLLAILLSPRLEKLQGGRVRLRGFVRASDFRIDLASPFSNRSDLIYINSTIRCGPGLESLLAHEGAHAVCCGQRAVRGLPVEEDWLNEAIAHVMEDLLTADRSNLNHRIAAFKTEPHRYPLIVADYYHAGLWRSDGCRGATFLFLRWIVSEFGTGMLQELVEGDAVGVSNLEAATGREFVSLFRRWGSQFDSGKSVVVADGISLSVALCGTSHRRVRIPLPVGSNHRTLVIRASRGAHLRVTIVKTQPTEHSVPSSDRLAQREE